MKISAQRFSRHLPIRVYTQLRLQYKAKHESTASTKINGRSENKVKSVNAQDIIDYFERGNKMNKRRLIK